MIQIYLDLRDCGFSRRRVVEMFLYGSAREMRDWYQTCRMGKWAQ